MSNGAMKFRANGQTVNTVVDPRFGLGSTPVQPFGWGGSGGGGEGSAVEVFVPPSGDTSGATDLANIQAAIDAATEPNPSDVNQITNVNNHFTEGRPVDIRLLGKYTINGPIILKQGCRLLGSGWMASTVHLAPNSNTSMVVVPERAYWIGIQDIHFDGHAEEQTTAEADSPPALDISPGGAVTIRADSCTVPFIYRVMVSYARGSAFRLSGVELRAQNCCAYRSKRYGFDISASDMWINDCMSGDSQRAGFFIGGGQHHVSNCKSWWSGYYQPDRTRLASGNQTHFEPGFLVRGASNMFVNCDAQDTSGVGWQIEGPENILRNCVSDSSRTGHFLLWGAAGNCTIEGHCRSVHKNTAGYAVKIEAWATTINNHVSVDFPDTRHNGELLTRQGLVLSGAAAAGADQRNVIRIGNPERTYTTAYAPAITPDPLLGGVDVTLTGNITIANTVADRSVHGTELSIMLTQDATGGRTVTWGSDYVGMSAVDTAPNKANLWRVRRVKGRWVQVGFVTY